jgi:Transposase IS66 family
VVASSARGYLATLDISFLFDTTAPRDRTAFRSGSGCEVPKTAGTCRDILKRRQALWTFVQVDGVEPSNNTVERALRPGVLWRKAAVVRRVQRVHALWKVG